MKNEVLKELFESFLNHYEEDQMNQIWSNQSHEFREFWNDRIMKSDNKELYDQEIDAIVRILDRHGKGNTSESEAIARVMIPQGAWRRLFNQLKEDNNLSNTIDSIFQADSKYDRIEKIDKLYKLNENNKNNLTGKSGNAINCLLAAYDPFNNLSIVSLNDRRKLLDSFNIDYSIENKSIGTQIVETSELIIHHFQNTNIYNNCRTLTKFVYSKRFLEMWKQEDSAPNSPIRLTETNFIDSNEISDETFIFYMEKQLEDFLIENWDKTELGKKYDLIENDDGLASQQYNTDIGKIDILAKDPSDGKYVVIELKKNQTSDDTIGQIARYMGWIEKHLSDGKSSKGIIIAGKYDKKLKYAMKKIKDIEVYLYKIDFNLEEYGE